MDYKYSINLPRSKFPMKGNLPQTEPNILKSWNTNYLSNIFRKKNFILNDGPPYANGDIHIGHAFNKILKDITCKYKYLMGYNVNFIPGWDCHGLPIELNVEKNIKNKNNDFRKECKNYADSQIKIQMKSFKRLGIFGNWDKSYKTMDKSFELSVIESFTDMFQKKYIYSGYKPNYWCFDCKSALAESEVEYYEKESHSIYLFFELEYNDLIMDKKIGLIVWTTTPWTIPFNAAIAINQNHKYIIIEKDNIQYILNRSLLAKVAKDTDLNDYKIIKPINVNTLKNIFVKHPIYDKTVKIVFSDHVKNDSGTGCVHIAPAYGHDDYKIGLKHNLEIINNISETGYFYENTDIFQNLFYEQINDIIINILKNKQILLSHKVIKHRYPHCWRHKSTLIFRTTDQWFVNVTNILLKNKIHYFIENHIEFIPQNGYTKIKNMLIDRIDWCISRQRYWGIPIIFFLDKDKKLHPDTSNILEKIKKYIKIYGTDFWYDDNLIKLLNIDQSKYNKLTDVLDVWFDSSSVYKYLHDEYKYKIPYDLCIEGSDQYRGWFQVSIINAIATSSQMPYKKIISHGFILDQKGKKMSKSLNNVISPTDIINKYGAETLRLWVTSTNYSTDINISNEIIERVCDTYKKIRNTFKFLISNTQKIKMDNVINNTSMPDIDQWIIFKIYNLKKNVLKNYNSYNFNSVYKKIYQLCTDEVGGKYLDLVKDRLYTINKNAVTRISAQTTCFYILYNFIKLSAPILSFTCEEAWSYLPVKDKLTVFESLYNTDLITFNLLKNNKIKKNILLDKLFKLKNKINKIIEQERLEKDLGGLLELILNLHCNIYWFNNFKKIETELHLFFQVSKINIIKNNGSTTKINIKIKKAQKTKCERCWHRVIEKNNIKICTRCIKNIYYNYETRQFI